MLYPQNKEPFSKTLFENPTSEYRGAPFWAWNTALDAQELCWQIEQFKRMGLGGFHMHVRTGLDTPYLGDAYMNIVDRCVKKAKEEGMLAWLYDEDRWPSGVAGGIVTENPAFRSWHLLCTQTPYGDADARRAFVGSGSGRAQRSENGVLLACFDVRLTPGGFLAGYDRIAPDEAARGIKLFVYQETNPPHPWFNGQTYVDTLNPAAIRAFLDVTHERYAQRLGDEFGKTIPAIFTDEPQFARKGALAFAHTAQDVTMPWTPDLPESYAAEYEGEDVLASLPELLWDLPESAISVARYRFHDHVAARFASAFADQCGAWCGQHGLMLAGHMMEEPTLKSQTAALGDAMRSYRAFQLPGIDLLCDRREFTTAKQAQSAARQYGREGVLSELYGVTNWDFDFRSQKLQGDWQAALGITVRVQHLSFASMNGEAKRDYPGTFQYQAPWYREYPLIEDHFARVNTVMTRGKPVCRVGVLHPVESYWLYWGAQETSADVRAQMETDFLDMTDWLLRGLVDFDFLCESLLPEQCALDAIAGRAFPVGAMQYDMVFVPPMKTMRRTTYKRLKAFAEAGGRVVFAGEAPSHIDAMQDDAVRKLACACVRIPMQRLAVLEAARPVQDVEIFSGNGLKTNGLLYQLREEGNARWLFIARADAAEYPDAPTCDMLHIRVRGMWKATVYHTLEGSSQPVPAHASEGWTQLTWRLHMHDSLLLRLEKSDGTAAPALQMDEKKEQQPDAVTRFLEPVPVTLHEPNVLLLDMAEYALDGVPLAPMEEILRLDNQLRGKLGWPLRCDSVAQPWTQQERDTPHVLRLLYTFESEMEVSGAALALEQPDGKAITLNGIAAETTGEWYVDKCMRKMALPAIQEGKNVLEVTMPYGPLVNLEAMYILGDFGVRVSGCNCLLTPPVRSLAFGDITRQGLPFYGGNITYHLEYGQKERREAVLTASDYRGHLLRVAVDGRDMGPLAFAPYQARLGMLDAGTHKVDITWFGNRINTFGQLHAVTHRKEHWWGPNAWRTAGNDWSYEYRFWPQGILKSPEVER